MAFKLLLISALIGSAFGIKCFDYRCQSLGEICVEKTDQKTIAVNNEDCGCGIEYGYPKQLETYPIGEHFVCADFSEEYMNYTGQSSSEEYYDEYRKKFECDTREDNRNLASTSDRSDYPVMCDSNADCLLDNGNYTECWCALDGNAYCLAHLDSYLYDDFWDECKDDFDVYEVVYWIWYRQYYPLQVNSPSCADNMFWELRYLRDLDAKRDPDSRNSDFSDSDSSDSALVLIFSTLGALPFIY